MRLALALAAVFALHALPASSADAERKVDAVQPAEGDANTPPQNGDRQQPGGAQTAPMPKDAMPVAPQVSDPREVGGNQGVKQAPAQPGAPEGGGAHPDTAGPPAPTGP